MDRTLLRAGLCLRGRWEGEAVKLLAPIYKAPPGVEFNQFGWHFKGTLCTPGGPLAPYTITNVDLGDPYSNGVRLKARREPCAKRRALLEGVWQRIN